MMKYRFEEIAYNCIEKKKPVEEDKYNYIGLEHLDTGCLYVNRYGSEIAPIGEKLIMHKGDVLFGKRRAYQKKVAIAPFDGIFSAHGMVLRPREDVVNRDFFPLFISSDYFLNAAIKISVGSLSPTINWSDLKELEFDLPDLNKQIKLAAILWSIISTLESYKKLLYVTDEIVKSQFIEMFGDIKSCPNKIKLGDLCDSITDGSHNPPKGVDYSLNYMLSSKNVFDGHITLDDPRYISNEDFERENKRTNVSAGDVLLTIVGAIGRTAIVPVDFPHVTFQRSVAVLHPKKKVDSIFLSKMLEMLEDTIETEAHGSAQKGIYLSQINDLEVILPSYDLQLKFAALVKQSDKSKFEIKQALDELNIIYKRILADNLG